MAIAATGMGKDTNNGAAPIRAPAGEANTHDMVPPNMPVMVATTGSPTVAPAAVTLKPVMKYCPLDGVGNVAMAAALATLPDDAESGDIVLGY